VSAPSLPRTSGRRALAAPAWAGAACLLAACGAGDAALSPFSIVALETPFAGRVASLQLTPDGADSFLVTWTEKEESSSAVRFARWQQGSWSAPLEVVRGRLFGHPTELPCVTRLSGGELAAVWQEEVDPPNGAVGHHYGIRAGISADGGRSWSRPLDVHPASTVAGEHEFFSAWPNPDGTLGLVWIDPRDLRVEPSPSGGEQYLGAMALMSNSVAPDGTLGVESIVDPVICECCPTSVAVTPEAWLVAYRDKSVPKEQPLHALRYEMDVVRDISLARTSGAPGRSAAWVDGLPGSEDRWTFDGCPNNGPSLASAGERVVLAWWTGQGGDPRVQVRLSGDGGRSFGPALRLDTGSADGQVSAGVIDGRAIVLWLQDEAVHARLAGVDGALSTALRLGDAPLRHRLPRLVSLADGSLVAGWVGPGGEIQLRRIVLES